MKGVAGSRGDLNRPLSFTKFKTMEEQQFNDYLQRIEDEDFTKRDIHF